MYYRLVSTPLGSGLLSGLTFGAVMGLLSGLDKGRLQAALIVAVVAGTAFGTIMGLTSISQLSTLGGLSPADRATVMRTMGKGETVTDRRLAPAVIAYADALGRRYQPRNLKWVVAAVAAVQVFLFVDDAVEGEWVWAAARIPVLVAILLLPRWVRRTEERRGRAERSARALLDPPS